MLVTSTGHPDGSEEGTANYRTTAFNIQLTPIPWVYRNFARI